MGEGHSLFCKRVDGHIPTGLQLDSSSLLLFMEKVQIPSWVVLTGVCACPWCPVGLPGPGTVLGLLPSK